jgi:hypothetical protein
MDLISTAGQFIAGCLAFGLGLFLLAGSLRDIHGLNPLPAVTARATVGLSSAALLAAGGLMAAAAVPIH